MLKETEKEEGRASQNTVDPSPDTPLKKRRLVNGAELVFKKPVDAIEDGTDDEEGPLPAEQEEAPIVTEGRHHRVAETSRITIVEDG